MVAVDKKERSCKIIDFAVPGDSKIEEKEKDKIEKYQDVGRELQKIWNVKENKQEKVQDREEKREAASIKTSDTTADVTNRVFIMGYSIVIHFGSYELSERVENCGVFVEKFSNAKVRCMEDYIEPALREMPSHVILHVDTNDVTTKQEAQQIVSLI